MDTGAEVNVLPPSSAERRRPHDSLTLGHTKLIKCFSDNSNFIYDTGGRQKKRPKKDESN